MSHGQVKRHEEVGASADVLDEGLSLSTKGNKSRDYKLTKVTTLMRAPGGGLRDGPKQSRGPAATPE